MISIRTCTKKDIPLLQKLARQIWPATYHSILTPGQIDYMMNMMYSQESLTEQIEHKNHTFLIITDEEEAVGYASFSAEEKEGVSFLRLHKIYLDKNVRGRGFGRRILDHLKKQAEQINARWIELNVNKNNPAIEFYLRAGFEKAGEEKIDIGSGYIMDDYVMRMKMFHAQI